MTRGLRSTVSFVDFEPADVRPGDHALHRNGQLDSRTVAYVDHEAGAIAINIGTHVSGLLPLRNYTYTRRIDAEDPT